MKWVAASALVADPHGYAPGRAAKKHLIQSDCRRGSSTVSARVADGPVTMGCVAVGIWRAGECRRMVGSHYQLLDQLVWLAGQGCCKHPWPALLTAFSDGCLRRVFVDDVGNDVTLAKQFGVVCRVAAVTSLSCQFWLRSRCSFSCRARSFAQFAHAGVTSSWRAVSSQISRATINASRSPT